MKNHLEATFGADPEAWVTEKMVRIRYWHQDTEEAGHFVLSGLLKRKSAEIILKSHAHERAEIVPDSEGV